MNRKLTAIDLFSGCGGFSYGFQQAGFHVTELNPVEAAKECEVPVYFLHGSDDSFVVPNHS